MRIAVIHASSQQGKNRLLYDAARRYAAGSEVINLGCGAEDTERFSYVEIALLAGMLLGSGAVDFVLTGCSSGQGMMLACNSVPGVLCGYAPTPRDAYLFARINNGNAVSLPLGEEYTYSGPENCMQTVEALFSEPFGGGWPKSEAARKLRDTELLRRLRRQSQVALIPFLEGLPAEMLRKLMKKTDVIAYILTHGTEEALLGWIRERQKDIPDK